MAEAPPPSDASPTLVVELGAARFDQPARYFLTLQLTMGGSKDRVIFSFWDSDVSPGYMVFDGRFKLMIGRQAKTDGARCDSAMPCVDEQGFDAPGVDALYGESRRLFLRSWYVASLLLLNNQTWPQT